MWSLQECGKCRVYKNVVYVELTRMWYMWGLQECGKCGVHDIKKSFNLCCEKLSCRPAYAVAQPGHYLCCFFLNKLHVFT